MIPTANIDCFGAILEAPDFLVSLWPHDLPLRRWPSFCGAGDGLGDRLVPDSIYLGLAQLQPACFIHDICWLISPNTTEAFFWSNEMFKRNLIALVDAQLCWPLRSMAHIRCEEYFTAVSTVGWFFFRHDYVAGQDPLENKVVRDKIHRLARVAYGIPGFDKDGGTMA